jgi:hypothetical protein
MMPMSKKTLTTSKVTTRDDKGRKFLRVVEDAYDKAGLSEEEAQRVNEASGLKELVEQHLAKNRTANRFVSEKVKSSYGYLSGYKPKGEDLDRQIAALKDLFPGLGDPDAEYLQQVKSGAVKVPRLGEKFFAIPNWVKKPELFGVTYGEALQKVLDLIKKTHDGKFVNHREGKLGPEYLRQSVCTTQFWNKLSEAQGNPDILIVAAQFGIRHRGKSVRRAREVFVGNEFGLGALAIGIMILTHPNRLAHYDDLWIDCAGDEYSPGADGDFYCAPCLRFNGGLIRFGASRVGDYSVGCGSASGFLPECPIS